MPAFGKSGMWRIFDLSSSMFVLTNIELGLESAGRHVGDIDPVDACSLRTTPDLLLEAVERLPITLAVDLDAAVRQITPPPDDSFARRGGLGEIPEADTLNTAADQIPSGDAHIQAASA